MSIKSKELKYKIVEGDFIIESGVTLYRIKATNSFDNVRKGELGGYIEKEENLSHEGNCWVDKNSKIRGNVEVKGGFYYHQQLYHI